jgi:hypothetical protein
MALELSYSSPRNVTPWDALLDEVRSLAGQVAFLDWKIGSITRVSGDEAILQGEESAGAARWVEMRRDRGELLARTSKMAIDAGVAQMLLQRVELQGELLYRAASEGIAAAVDRLNLPLDEEAQLDLVASIARQVVRLEEEQETKALTALKTLDGELG